MNLLCVSNPSPHVWVPKKGNNNMVGNLLYLCQQFIPTCVGAKTLLQIMEMTSIALRHLPPNGVTIRNGYMTGRRGSPK